LRSRYLAIVYSLVRSGPSWPVHSRDGAAHEFSTSSGDFFRHLSR
jgi:hypothetical protein